MTNIEKENLLTHLHHIEEDINYKIQEAIQYANSKSFFVATAASIASDLACLQERQRAICYTLRLLGYYVVYENEHATDIVANKGE